MTYYSEYSKVWVSVDCIIFGFENGKLKVLLGRRKMEPGKGMLSLYGGFVRPDESIDACAERTLQELTGLKHLYMQQVGAFGNVERDPGERVISIAYYALINVKDYDEKLRKAFDAQWVDINAVPQLYSDHHLMINKATEQMRQIIKTNPIGFNLLPTLFTLTQLQRLYEAVLGEEIDKRNFRKRIKDLDCIEKTELVDKLTSKRGAALYRFNKKAYNEVKTFKL